MEGPKPELVYEALRKNPEEEILIQFTEEEQKEILRKKRILSSLAYFIGKDFRIPIELGLPTQDCPSGWRQGNKADGSRFLQMNAHDLLHKSEDFLRFVVSHEAGHARISRLGFIPLEVWRQQGFSFLMNAIEDPRDNNFLAESSPGFLEQMKSVYESQFEQEEQMKLRAKESLGYHPRFMQAGFEFIRLWFKEKTKKDMEISSDLSEEIKEIIKRTLESAKNAWWSYPTKSEADSGGVLPNGQQTDGESVIVEFAKQVYNTILEEIWPEFQKLIEKDKEDQKMSELLKDLQKGKQGKQKKEESGESDSESGEDGGDGGIPKELKDRLSSEEQKELEEAISKAIDEAKKDAKKTKESQEGQSENGEETKGEKIESEDGGKEGENGQSEDGDGGQVSESQSVGKPKVIDIDSLSPSLKNKIKEYIDSLSENKKKELTQKAEKALKEFEEEINKEIEGKLTENPEERKQREDREKDSKSREEKGDKEDDESQPEEQRQDEKEGEERRKQIERDSLEILNNVKKGLEGQTDEYQREMTRLLPQIKALKEKLAEIFQERRKRGIRSGFEEGEEIDVERRFQEKAKGISIFESKAWRRTELPREKDYAITLLVDLSGSMQGEKINEAFEATILFTEVLNSLGIKTEILGFNVRLYEYQKFSDRFSNEIRKKIITMKNQVKLPGMEDNDDGWAVTETAKRLEGRKEREKLLLVISDGEPDNSRGHDGPEYELGSVVGEITKSGKVKIVGLGLGSSGISAVRQFYPKHLLANSAEEMIEKIGDLLLEVIKG